MALTRWLRITTVWIAVATLVAGSCTWQLGMLVPLAVPPPAGEHVPDIDTHAHGRPADQLYSWAAAHAQALGMPVTALEAYAYAAKVAEVENPNCHLTWPTLAAIGMVESKNGTYRGATINANGDVTPHIRGVRLDGSDGNLVIVDSADPDRDSDGGFQQAMGPMQFIPETWRLYAVDAHNNGVSSPDNIDDAALSAAGYLCFRGGNLATGRGWMAALLAYNHSLVYARTVRNWAVAYAGGHPL